MLRINEIISKTFKIPLEEVQENFEMKDVESWDSLSHMNLIVLIEEEFKIELSGDDIAEMVTFDAIRNILNKYINK